jgi:hypothetical protein
MKRPLIFMALIFLVGCASSDYVGDPNGLLLPDGTSMVATTTSAGIPIIGSPLRTTTIWRHDPKINRTEYLWSTSSSGQLSMPDLSKVPIGISVP